MKMGQKGMSTGAIVAIVVTVVVVVVVVSAAAVLLIGGGGVGAGSLPTYTGATESEGAGLGGTSNFVKNGVGRENVGSISDKPQGLDDKLYVAPAATTSVSEVINWYKTNMASQGWTLVCEENYSYDYMSYSMSWGLLYFDKGDRSAAVVVGEYGGEIYFALVEGPDSLFDPWMDDAGYEWVEPTITTTPSGGEVTSLSCKVDFTYEGLAYTMTVKMKDIGSDDIKIRIEGDMMGQEFIGIINGELQQAWMCIDGQWQQDTTGYLSDLLDFSQYQTELSGWTGEDITYTDPTTGMSIRIYDIVPNPTLDDSLFIGQGGETTTWTPTGTPTTTTTPPTTTPTTTTTPSGGIESATSLDYKVDYTWEGQMMTYRYRTRNIGSTNLDLRIDMTTSGMTTSYILSGSQQQGWIYVGTQWMSFSDLYMDFSEYWSQYGDDLSTYTGYLSDWTSGEWSETYGGVTYRIYDIDVDPSLPDSVFQPS